MISQTNKEGFRNPWPLGMIALIIIVLGVNGTFIWFASHSRSTLVDRDYDTHDRKSNAEVLGDLQAQKALAWKTTLTQPKSVVVGSPAAYQISVADREGAPVDGAMEVKAYRAADEGKDFAIAFRQISPGLYQGDVTFPLKGYWELRIRVKRGDEIFEVGTKKFMVAAA